MLVWWKIWPQGSLRATALCPSTTNGWVARARFSPRLYLILGLIQFLAIQKGNWVHIYLEGKWCLRVRFSHMSAVIGHMKGSYYQKHMVMKSLHCCVCVCVRVAHIYISPYRMQRMPSNRWAASGWVGGRSELTGPRESPQRPKPPMRVSPCRMTSELPP